jgi:sugar O-acyltransferase (sialic acid O-acetyltransferase NeuD family)
MDIFMKPVVFGLLGAGGFAREVMPFTRKSVAHSLRVQEEKVAVYFVETFQPDRSEVNGYPLISLDAFLNLIGQKYFNVAVGNVREREAMVNAIGGRAKPLSLFAEQALVLDCNQIGEGAVFCPNTMVTSNTQIGDFFQCNIYSYVAHDCIIGNYVTFAPGVRCNGRVHIEDYSYIGTNAIIREGSFGKPLQIGKGAIVGMGAVVTKDVPEGVTVIGNPARPLIKK